MSLPRVVAPSSSGKKLPLPPFPTTVGLPAPAPAQRRHLHTGQAAPLAALSSRSVLARAAHVPELVPQRVLSGVRPETRAAPPAGHRASIAMAVAGKRAAAGGKGGKKKTQTFVIDCTKPVEDKIMDIASFEKFLLDRIKVDGKRCAPP